MASGRLKNTIRLSEFARYREHFVATGQSALVEHLDKTLENYHQQADAFEHIIDGIRQTETGHFDQEIYNQRIALENIYANKLDAILDFFETPNEEQILSIKRAHTQEQLTLLQDFLQETIFNERISPFMDYNDYTLPANPVLLVATSPTGEYFLRFVDESFAASLQRHPQTFEEVTPDNLCRNPAMLACVHEIRDICRQVANIVVDDLTRAQLNDILDNIRILRTRWIYFQELTEQSHQKLQPLFLTYTFNEAFFTPEGLVLLRDTLHTTNQQIGRACADLGFPITSASLTDANAGYRRIQKIKDNFYNAVTVQRKLKTQADWQTLHAQLASITCPITHAIPARPMLMVSPIDGAYIIDQDVIEQLRYPNIFIRHDTLHFVGIIGRLSTEINALLANDELSLGQICNINDKMTRIQELLPLALQDREAAINAPECQKQLREAYLRAARQLIDDWRQNLIIPAIFQDERIYRWIDEQQTQLQTLLMQLENVPLENNQSRDILFQLLEATIQGMGPMFLAECETIYQELAARNAQCLRQWEQTRLDYIPSADSTVVFNRHGRWKFNDIHDRATLDISPALQVRITKLIADCYAVQQEMIGLTEPDNDLFAHAHPQKIEVALEIYQELRMQFLHCVNDIKVAHDGIFRNECIRDAMAEVTELYNRMYNQLTSLADFIPEATAYANQQQTILRRAVDQAFSPESCSALELERATEEIARLFEATRDDFYAHLHSTVALRDDRRTAYRTETLNTLQREYEATRELIVSGFHEEYLEVYQDMMRRIDFGASKHEIDMTLARFHTNREDILRQSEDYYTNKTRQVHDDIARTTARRSNLQEQDMVALETAINRRIRATRNEDLIRGIVNYIPQLVAYLDEISGYRRRWLRLNQDGAVDVAIETPRFTRWLEEADRLLQAGVNVHTPEERNALAMIFRKMNAELLKINIRHRLRLDDADFWLEQRGSGLFKRHWPAGIDGVRAAVAPTTTYASIEATDATPGAAPRDDRFDSPAERIDDDGFVVDATPHTLHTAVMDAIARGRREAGKLLPGRSARKDLLTATWDDLIMGTLTFRDPGAAGPAPRDRG